MRGFAIGVLGCLLAAGTGFGASAQSLLEGQECRPPVASPAGYRDCRTHVAAGQEVCRCKIVPGLDIARRSSVNEAVSTRAPAPTSSTRSAPGAAAAALQP